MGQLIREEFNQKLNVEYYLGIPREHEPRIAPLHGVPILRSLAKVWFGGQLPAGAQNVLDWNSVGYKAIFSQPRQIIPWPHSHNRKQIWRSEGPSFSGITNSPTLALFASIMANNGSLANSEQIISHETIENAHKRLPFMKDKVVSRNVTFTVGGFGTDMTFPGSKTKVITPSNFSGLDGEVLEARLCFGTEK